MLRISIRTTFLAVFAYIPQRSPFSILPSPTLTDRPSPVPVLTRMPALPFTLEDRTGRVAGSDFDDIYDRIFLRVAPATYQRGASTLLVYKMSQRASRRRDSLPFHSAPSIVLEFGGGGALGHISFMDRKDQIPLHMGRYLRRTSLFGGCVWFFLVALCFFFFLLSAARLTNGDCCRSLFRKFLASDGHEYRWSYRTVPGQEWSVSQ